ncbi:MAG: Ni/Fe hydrogenase subunit alpha [Candidatus Njordarchaeales archaeon]
MREIKILPISRLEGEGEITIILDDEGKVKEAFFHVVEFKGFEKFCVGRPVEEMPRIVTRICGVCPWAHHMASTKALDEIFGREPTETAKKIRELAYCAHIIDSHTVHFYILAIPDFILSPGAPRSERNVIGMFKKNPELVKNIVKHRKYIVKIEEIIGGKSIHPVCGLPGGVSKRLTEEERKEILEMGKELVKFFEEWIEKFESLILKNYEKLFIQKDMYYLETYYMGLVDRNNKVNFYDGDIRVVDQKGREVAKFRPIEYLDYIRERVEPWSYTKFPYLKNIGWKGFVDGPESGIYRVGPLGRLNVADGFATEKAQEAYEKYIETLGKPAHYTMAYHWARVIEMLYASERIVELASDDAITSDDIVNYEGEFSGKGVGVVEAPRGILYHHYETDSNGIVTLVNLVIPTTQNNPAINMDVKKAAQHLITNGKVSDEILNMVEMAFRAYDPCLACSTHSLPGGIPLKVVIKNERGEVIKVLRRE